MTFRVLGLAEPLLYAVDGGGLGSMEENAGICSFIMANLQGAATEVFRVGRKVNYEKGRGPKGPRAEKVRPE
jgi:cold shock CspA family protein